MTKFRKRIHRIKEFDRCLDIIEDNLSYSTKSILETLRGRGYSEKTLDNMMKNFYICDKGYNKTIRAYIKRRKNKENLLKRSRFLYKEDKYNTFHISKKTMLLDIVDNYNFCNLRMKGSDVSISKVNLRKLLKETFRRDIFIYPKIKNMDEYESKAIIDFNENFLGKKFEHYNMYKYLKFNYFYTHNTITINNITYYLNDRRWIHSSMEEIVNTSEYMKFNNNFYNYGTVLYNTKEFLKVMMDRNNETLNRYRDELKITCEKDIDSYYEKSVEEIKSKMTEDEWIVFEAILKIENKKDCNFRPVFYRHYKTILLALLTKGYIHIK